jgi:hypothetical protein
MNLLHWLYVQPVSTLVRESYTIFPALECIHLYSMIVLITTIAAFDLRLLGVQVGRHPLPLPRLAKLVIRFAGLAIAVNFLTGSFLFASKAPDYYVNVAFRIKMALILAGIAYHFVLFSKALKWENTPAQSIALKFVGGISLLLWIGVIAASRWIAFTNQ